MLKEERDLRGSVELRTDIPLPGSMVFLDAVEGTVAGRVPAKFWLVDTRTLMLVAPVHFMVPFDGIFRAGFELEGYADFGGPMQTPEEYPASVGQVITIKSP